jgi:hypothetical protein
MAAGQQLQLWPPLLAFVLCILWYTTGKGQYLRETRSGCTLMLQSVCRPLLQQRGKVETVINCCSSS